MSIVKLSVADVLSYLNQKFPGREAVYEVTPISSSEVTKYSPGHAPSTSQGFFESQHSHFNADVEIRSVDYFAHVFLKSQGEPIASAEGKTLRYVSTSDGVDIDDVYGGHSSLELLMHFSHDPATGRVLVTQMTYDHQRWSLAGLLLACARDEHGLTMVSQALKLGVCGDKDYQPVELINLCHRLHQARARVTQVLTPPSGWATFETSSLMLVRPSMDEIVFESIDVFPFQSVERS